MEFGFLRMDNTFREDIYGGDSYLLKLLDREIAEEGAGIYRVEVAAQAPLGNVYMNGPDSGTFRSLRNSILKWDSYSYEQQRSP